MPFGWGWDTPPEMFYGNRQYMGIFEKIYIVIYLGVWLIFFLYNYIVLFSNVKPDKLIHMYLPTWIFMPDIFYEPGKKARIRIIIGLLAFVPMLYLNYLIFD